MSKTRTSSSVSITTRARLEMQGFTGYSDRELASFGPWLRLVPSSIAILSLVATILGGSRLFLAFAPIFLAGIALPHHPFDAISSRLRGRRALPIPRSPAQRRFSYAFASVAMLVAAWLFVVNPSAARVLGAVMVVIVAGTAKSQFCMAAWLLGRVASILCRMRGLASTDQCL